jgi:hypothetical protein
MKKALCLLFVCLSVFSLSACAGLKQTETSDTSVKTEDNNKKEKLQFSLGSPLTKEENFTGENGIVLLKEKYELPQLELHTADGTLCSLDTEFENSTDKQMAYACRTFNAEMKSVAEKFDTAAQEQLKTATEHYNDIAESGRSAWISYSEELTIDTPYMTDGFLSVLGNGYSNSGGAHPITYSRTWNFDLTTGQFLTFDSLTDDNNPLGSAMDSAITTPIFDEINAKGLEKSYFEDYTSVVEDFSNKASIYFQENGMAVRFDVDVIAPYATGPQTFTVSYDKFYYALSEHMQSLIKLSDEDGIVSDYYATQTLWQWFNMSMPPFDSSAEKVTIEGTERYKVALGSIKTLSDLRKLLCSHVSEEIADEWIKTGKFAESDGALYSSQGERGADVTVGTMEFSVKIDGDSGTLTQTVHRWEYDESKKTFTDTGKTDTYEFPFILKEGHAVFSAFPCPL